MDQIKLSTSKNTIPCSIEFIKRAEFSYVHSFGFKFEFPNFAICFCKGINSLVVSYAKNSTGSNTLIFKKFYDTNILVVYVHWSEYSLIESILTCFLEMKMPFITNNNLFMKFSPITHKYYSKELEEKLAVHKYTLLIETYFNDKYEFHESLFCLDNWQTAIGRNFCKRLCEVINK